MFELELYLPGSDAENISDFLFELGALSVTLLDAKDHPIFEPAPDTLPLWPEIKLSALFSADISLDSILLQLYTHENAKHLRHITKKIVAEEDWVRKTQASMHAQCFSGKLWIYPSWDVPTDENTAKVLLDPGLAFGTGSHATTALILNWLASHPPKHLTVLDYGCGSGILGIAAAKLGADVVYAVDIDPQAIMASQSNAQANQVNLLFDLPKNLKVNLILANILAEPLIELQQVFIDFLLPNGKLVLSGILKKQVPMLLEAYKDNFLLETQHEKDDWSMLVFVNNA